MCVDEVCVRRAEDGGVLDAAFDVSVDVSTDVTVDVDARYDAAPDADASDGGGDSGVDAGPPRPFCERNPTAIACLDFEAPAPIGWELDSSVGSDATLDTTLAFESTSSLRIDIGRGGRAWYERSPLGPVTTGSIWLRARVFLSETGATATNFVPLISLNETNSPFATLTLALVDGGRIGWFLDRGGSASSSRTTARVPREVWSCVELEIRIGTGAVRLYVDGTMLNSATGTFAGAWDRIFVGIPFEFADQSPITYWLDDVAWSATRLACDPPSA